jgi:DNA-binding YbaB/EbfC family protein
MFGDIGKMMKQVNEMKSKMKDVEKELNSMLLKASSGDGKVEVELTGKMDVKTLRIAPDLVATNDVKKVEKSVQEAFTKAINLAKNTAASKLGAVTGGMNLPGM